MPLRVQPSPSVWLVERGSPVPPFVAMPDRAGQRVVDLGGHREPGADALALLLDGRFRIHGLVPVAHVGLPADARGPVGRFA
mgnify:CR=1 FL=1